MILSQHTIDLNGAAYNHRLMTDIQSHNSKQTPICLLLAEKIDEAAFLNLIKFALPAFFFGKLKFTLFISAIFFFQGTVGIEDIWTS